MDALGHVNNVVYLRYLQEARVDMLFVHAPRHGAEHLARGVVVSRHEIGYRAPLRFRPQPVRVETWVRRVDAASFALGSSVLVPYDLDKGRLRRVAAQERAVLESFHEVGGPEPGKAA
jgi:acyl-CoA thioester hydrolase